MTHLAKSGKALLDETWELYWTLIKVMIPVMIAVKVAADLGAIEIIASSFAPVMTLVGLPGEMGIVWVTALLINIYAGAAALVTLLPNSPLTVADATVLGTMMLVAHAIPVEQRIAQLAGPSFWFTSALRIASAILLGFILHHSYAALEMLQEPVDIAWLPASDENAGWTIWAMDSLQTLATIFLILLALIITLKVLEKIGVTVFLGRMLAPFLRLIGIGETAVPLTLSGLLLGLSYGGALVIKEARSGRLSRRDVFLSISFLCLCHSIIEDTLFIMALGGHISGVLFARLVFTIAVIALLAYLVTKMPEDRFRRYLCADSV